MSEEHVCGRAAWPEEAGGHCPCACHAPKPAEAAMDEAEIERLARIAYRAAYNDPDDRHWDRMKDRSLWVRGIRAVAAEAVAKVTGERDRLRTEALEQGERAYHAEGRLAAARARLAEVEAALGRLHAVLDECGQHTYRCHAQYDGPCNCGLNAALAATGDGGAVMTEKTRQGRDISESELQEHLKLCDALWEAKPEDYKERAERRCGRVYFCDGVWAATSVLRPPRTVVADGEQEGR